MRSKGLIWGLGAVALLIITYAWVDGGLSPVRDMAVPVAVPGTPR